MKWCIEWLKMAYRLWLAHGTATTLRYAVYLLTAARTGNWEYWLQDRVGLGRTAIDIGASFGQWTRFLADRFDHVAAFEPHPDTCVNLLGKAPDNTRVYPYAAWNADAKLSMVTYPDSRVNRVVDHELQYAIGNGVWTQEVEARRLDSFKIENVDFIKIDAEGAEVQVLQGARETIQADMPMLIIELHSAKARVECLATLEDWGYETELVHFPLYRRNDPKYWQRLWIIARPALPF
jgi:FkbM family methyltransferase